MQDLSDDDRKQILGEVLLDELKAIREGIADLPTRREFNKLRDDVTDLKSDVKVIKAVVMDQSRQLTDHERRLTPP